MKKIIFAALAAAIGTASAATYKVDEHGTDGSRFECFGLIPEIKQI